MKYSSCNKNRGSLIKAGTRNRDAHNINMEGKWSIISCFLMLLYFSKTMIQKQSLILIFLYTVSLANNLLEEYKCDANLSIHFKLSKCKMLIQLAQFSKL